MNISRLVFILFFIFFIQVNLHSHDVSFIFYGKSVHLTIDYEFQEIHSSCIKEEYVWEMNMYIKNLSENDFNWLYKQIDTCVAYFQIGDYGRKLLLEKCFEEYFNGKNVSSVFYTWYFSCKTNYNAVLINQECDWEVLYASKDSLRMPYIVFGSHKYYLIANNSKINLCNIDNVFIYEQGLSIAGSNSIKILNKISESFPINLKETHIEFYYDSLKYEFTGFGNINLSNFFLDLPNFEFTPVYNNIGCSKLLKDSLVKFIKNKTKNFSIFKSVDFALRFVQEGIRYRQDSFVNQIGIWQFPETSLLLRHGDCEDKSILMYYILQNAFELDCILLDYGSHVNIGVSITHAPSHFDYIIHKGIKFYICDPAGKGYLFGQMPKEYKNIKPKIYSVKE